MKRSFELLDGKSAKFWEIVLDGDSHTVRYGKLGSKGTAKTKSFADGSKAQKDADKLIASKTKKGYVEVAQDSDAAPAFDPVALAAELAKLDLDSSPEARQVFGDWLQSIGHPWGQLISLDHAGQHDERDALLVSTPSLLGELARRTKHVSLVWRQGFIDEATLTSGGNAKLLQQCMQGLFSLPVARYLRRLVLDGAPETFKTYRDWDSSHENMVRPFAPLVLRELGKVPKSLEELAFGAPPPRGASAYVGMPKLKTVSELLPELEVLEVQCSGDEELETFAFAKLRRLDMRLSNANEQALSALRECELPVLEQLSVWLGGEVHCILDDVYAPDEYDEDYDGLRYPDSYSGTDLDAMNVYSADSSIRAEVIREFCDASWPASLTRLGLQSAIFDEASLVALCQSKLVGRLTHLDLSGGTLSEAQSKVLIRCAKQLVHLEHIDLRRNHLRDKQVEALTKALPNADCSEQRRGDKAPEFLFRYVATME